MESGWDPDVKKYLLKVLNSFAMGLIWLILSASIGIYYGLAYKNTLSAILFFIGLAISLALLLYYYHRQWKK
jgi:hypothetical protein